MAESYEGSWPAPISGRVSGDEMAPCSPFLAWAVFALGSAQGSRWVTWRTVRGVCSGFAFAR